MRQPKLRGSNRIISNKLSFLQFDSCQKLTYLKKLFKSTLKSTSISAATPPKRCV